MSTARRAKDREPAPQKSPESATAREDERVDDEAVEDTVNVPAAGGGDRSVLPGPPIPPREQEKIRNEKKPR